MRWVITPAFFVVPEATQGYVNLTVFSSRGHDIVPTIINTPPWPSTSHFHGHQLLAASLAPKVSPWSHKQSNPPVPLPEMRGGTRRRGTTPRPPSRGWWAGAITCSCCNCLTWSTSGSVRARRSAVMGSGGAVTGAGRCPWASAARARKWRRRRGMDGGVLSFERDQHHRSRRWIQFVADRAMVLILRLTLILFLWA